METIMQDLQTATITVNELLEISETIQATDIQNKLKTFQGMFRQHKITVQKNISAVIPTIRNGEVGEETLKKPLTSHYSSPFTNEMMKKWLDEKRGELQVLRSYIDTFENQKNVRTVSLTQHNEFIFSPNYDSVVAFVFTSLKYEEPYILDLKRFLYSEELLKRMDRSGTEVSVGKAVKDDKSPPWFLTPEISETMRETFDLFKGASDVNKEEQKIKFVITYISDPTHPGASIYLHQRGKLVDTQYKPIQKPLPPAVFGIEVSSITLKLQSSTSSKILRFRVEIKEESGQHDWRIIDTQENQDQENWIISGLQPDTVYLLRYRTVCAGGVSQPSDTVKIHTKGRTVAFTAKLRSAESYPPGNQPIKFTNVLTNEGGGYNLETGIFTCPDAGFYYITVHAAVANLAEYGIFKNNERMVTSFNNQGDTMISSGTVMQLSKNDRVYVQILGADRNRIYTSEDNQSVFAGFRLF